MVLMGIRFSAHSYSMWTHFYLNAKIDNLYFRVNPLQLANFLNKHIAEIKLPRYLLADDGFAFFIDVPENIASAIKYMGHAKASDEDLEEIVQTGKTKLHKFVEEAGLSDIKKNIWDLVGEPIMCQSFELCLSSFPTLTLTYKHNTIKFKAEGTASLIRKLRSGELSVHDLEMLKALFLLNGKDTQDKYMQLLASGHLTMDDLAKAIYRSTINSKNMDKETMNATLEWLEHNGYKNKISLIVARSLLAGAEA